MTDPVSVILGVLGAAAASAQLAKVVHDFSDKVKNAPNQMRDIAWNMSLLSNIFKSLAEILEYGEGLYKPQVLIDTQSIMDRMKKIQRRIRKLVANHSGLRARVRWLLNSGIVAELLGKIEALKSSLNLIINTMQLAVACENRATSPMESVEYTELDQYMC